ncbi:MAG: hypothetical protein ACRC4M_04555 [Mycoplasma sp.]
METKWIKWIKNLSITIGFQEVGFCLILGLGVGGGVTLINTQDTMRNYQNIKTNVELNDEGLEEIKSIGTGTWNWLELYDKDGNEILSKNETTDWKKFLSNESKVGSIEESDVEVISNNLITFLQAKGYENFKESWDNKLKSNLIENKNLYQINSNAFTGWFWGTIVGIVSGTALCGFGLASGKRCLFGKEKKINQEENNLNIIEENIVETKVVCLNE